MAHELTHVVQQRLSGNNSDVQHKLAVSKPDDADEHEATRIADVVMSGNSIPAEAFAQIKPSVQRASDDQPTSSNTSPVPHSDYKPTPSNCGHYLKPELEAYLGSFYSGNAYSACIGTPDEVHNNCVRYCLQFKLTNFIEQMKREKRAKASEVQLPAGEGISRCKTIWEHHNQCYRECGCQNPFIEGGHFFTMCDQPWSPEFVSWSIRRWNPCMGPRKTTILPPYVNPFHLSK
jgi:hypothetical protein